jgi:electron transport complex protein RnfB
VVTDPNVSPHLCFPGKEEVAEAVAEITGKKAGAVDPIVAVVHCSRVQGNVHRKYNYIGYGNCSGADLAFAGPFECQYGCVGFGECAEACPFGAITMKDGFPEVDEEKCVGCGTCVRTCPKKIIRLVPRSARVIVRCSTKNPALATRSTCEQGCIHCESCIRECPAGAISIRNGVVVVDHRKCMEYGPDCGEACIDACEVLHIIQPFKTLDAARGKEKAADSQEQRTAS